MELIKRNFNKIILVISTIAVVSFYLTNTKGEYGNYPLVDRYTDHYSHVFATLLLPHRGFDIYAKPMEEVCHYKLPRVGPQPLKARHECNIDERKEQRSLYINWRNNPRVYPPGSQAYSLLEAALWQHTGISFKNLNLIIVVKYLLAAQLFLWLMLFFRFHLGHSAHSRHWTILRSIIIGYAYLECLHWSMMGQYDVIAVSFNFLAIFYFIQKRFLISALVWSIAVFLHYRSLWFLSIFCISMYNFLKEKQKTNFVLNKKEIAMVIAIGLIGVVSATSFFMSYPFFSKFNQSNPIYFGLYRRSDYYLILTFLSALVFIGVRYKVLLLSTLGWQLFVVLHTPELRVWHLLFTLPLLATVYMKKHPVWFVSASCVVAAQILYIFKAGFLTFWF